MFDETALEAIKTLAIKTENQKRNAQKQKIKAEQSARLKALAKSYAFLTVGETVYQFPKTLVLPEKFARGLEAQGQNIANFKLSAIKPKGSTPIQVTDLRIAVRRASTVLARTAQGEKITTTENPNGGYIVTGNLQKATKMAWPNLVGKSDKDFLSAVHPKDIGIFIEY